MRARDLLLDLPECRRFRFSSLYRTDAVNCPEPLYFLNAAVLFDTKLEPEPLLIRLLEIEQILGRERPYPNAPRRLDLDLLLYGHHSIQSANLQTPHPRLRERLFVLIPLAEIWGSFQHPQFGKTLAEIAHEQTQRNRDQSVIKNSQQWLVDHLR